MLKILKDILKQKKRYFAKNYLFKAMLRYTLIIRRTHVHLIIT